MLHFIVTGPLFLVSLLYERRNKGNDNLSSAATMAVEARRKEEVRPMLVKTYVMVHT